MSKRGPSVLRGAVVAGAMLAAVTVSPTAAHAVSGGGCGAWNPVDACISWNRDGGGKLFADFYMNVAPDYSRCIAVLGISKNGSFVIQQTYNLNGTGRYGPIDRTTATLPATSGNGFARVAVYNCDWKWQSQQDSPTIYWG